MSNAELSRDGSKKVKEVCKDFMTREDEALAQRLQDEEFQTHYIRNRQERGTARVDVKAAKNAYLEEVKQAGLLREYEYQRLAADDAWLASELQHRLDEEENLEAQQRTASEMQDEEYAQFLQQREKEKVKKERQKRLKNRIERERRELERIERESHQGQEPEEQPRTEYGFPHSGSRKEKFSKEEGKDVNGHRVSLKQDDESWNDLRSYEADDVATAAEERHRQQELEDEELARRLQRREEEKLRRLMEERDRRLALKMQKKETEEYRRERAERQSRKASSMKEQAESSSTGEHSTKSDHNRNSHQHYKDSASHCDPSLHYYEKPVLASEVPSGQKENSMERRPKSNSITSRNRGDIPVYEFVDLEIPTDDAAMTHNETHREPRSNQRVPERVENERLQKHGGSLKSNEFPPADHSVPSNHDDINDATEMRGNPRFQNVAASIDPTFKGEFKESEPTDTEERIWEIGNSGIKVSSSSKPAPVIQNTKRKQSKDKSARDKDKCKQQ